jgi:hypothetical protein
VFKTLTILLLSFNGEMIMHDIALDPPVDIIGCSELADQWRAENTTHFWEIGGDTSKQGFYLNDASGTMQGHICQ